MNGTLRFSLGKKLTLMIVSMGVVLTVVAGLVSYRSFSFSMTEYYTTLGTNLTRTLASQLSPDELDGYYETGEMDQRYYDIQGFIRDLVESNDVEYLYVVRPHDVGVTFLFDSDMEMEGADEGYYAGGYCALGSYVELAGGFADNLDLLLAGKPVEPIVEQDEAYGWMMTAMTPICHEDGTVSAYVMADISMNHVMQQRQTFLMGLAVSLVLLTLVFIALCLMFLRRKVIRPIDRLTQAAEAFIENDREGLDAGEVSVNVPDIHTGDEVEQLADAFRKLEGDIATYIQDVKRVTADKERIGAELNVATRIQAAMLPSIFPAFPDREEFDIYATMNPAKEVGGDFYDFYLIDEDHLAMVIADVSGKGVPAALFMVIAKTILKNHALGGVAPGEVFTAANQQLCEGNDTGFFVTAWMGMLELSSGTMTFVNAGHNPPLLRGEDGTFRWLRSRPGFVLAGLEGIRYRENTITLYPGDRLFLYTDGVTEGTDARQTLFGEKRLEASLNGTGGLSVQGMLEKVKGDLDAFVGEAEQFDDITMLGLEYRGNPAEGPRGKNTMVTTEKTFPAQLEELENVQAFVRGILSDGGCTRRNLLQMEMAVEEIFVNVARYAYPDRADGEVLLRCGVDQSLCLGRVQFIDSGIPFDPLAKKDADVTLSAEERQIGGLGIYMVKKTMDEMSYRYEDGRNILTLGRRLGD